MDRIRRFKNRIQMSLVKNNSGMTLVEMIVSFALLAIFLAASASVISTITTMYYQIKCETYAKQVGDIVMEKVVSEIEGAKYYESQPANNPVIDGDVDADHKYGSSITMFDRTDTRVTVQVNNKLLEIVYAEITGSTSIQRNETTWRFNNSMYNGFEIKEFKLIRGDAFKTGAPELTEATAKAAEYGLTISENSYDKNVVLVVMTLHNEKYGDYQFYRFVRMYNMPDTP